MELREQVTRCSRCILPSSLPGSDFDGENTCAWCRSGYPNYVPLGEEKLLPMLEAARKRRGQADCLVGVSGGKDSSYALLQLTRKYGLRAEAFTYVHDGLTESALENARKMAETMGVQHHVVSLPGHKHRDLFMAFFQAWLESENGLTAAMTCVPCKHLHLLGTRLAHRRGIPLVVWASCPLEVPPFLPTQPRGAVNTKPRGMLSLAQTLLKQIVVDRGFRKAFFGDTGVCISGCLAFRPKCAYLRVRYPSVEHLRYFRYVPWNARRILATLKSETSWQPLTGGASGWHSDCRFHVLKEYMFLRMVGATYGDAFVSNQIRHGLMTREEAWREVMQSRRFLTEDLSTALRELELQSFASRLNPECFSLEAA